MTLLLRAAAIVAALVLLPVAPLRAQDVAPLAMRSGHSVILPARGLTHVAVGDSRIVGVAVVGDSEIVLNAKAIGRTTVIVWAGPHRTAYEVQVSEQSLDDLAQMMRAAIPDRDVSVVGFDRAIIVRGSVADPERAAAIAEIVDRFAKVAQSAKYTVVDTVTVAHPLGPLQSQLAVTPGGAGVRIDRDEKGNLVVTGRVHDRMTAEALLDRVRSLSGAYLAADAKVIDRLTFETTSQIDVKVYVLEVDRTALEQLGVRLQNATPTQQGYVLGNPTFPVLESPDANGTGRAGTGPGIPGRGLNIGAFYRSVVLAPTIDLIMRSGHARLLSAPDLVTMPGRQATFLVGGQIPIPYSAGPQQIAIQYQEFGVKLQVTPTLTPLGTVETVIAPEVSDLDFADGVQLNGFVVPALKTSTLSTDVVTQPGESIVMGGMLRHVEQRNVDKIPGLGDLPILGKLFRSTSYQSQDTDVVFVMTPQVLVR
ncbi:MAG: pilus assembly protein N-terminal domain-containing protein [Candidatus Eremiobacteraeota bacterium]|nr:pilus assembly protein N-terminal domain-containing protein [Candidatus Eremiobacteraeota bacterium]